MDIIDCTGLWSCTQGESVVKIKGVFIMIKLSDDLVYLQET